MDGAEAVLTYGISGWPTWVHHEGREMHGEDPRDMRDQIRRVEGEAGRNVSGGAWRQGVTPPCNLLRASRGSMLAARALQAWGPLGARLQPLELPSMSRFIRNWPALPDLDRRLPRSARRAGGMEPGAAYPAHGTRARLLTVPLPAGK
jgi:hypothetical protein